VVFILASFRELCLSSVAPSRLYYPGRSETVCMSPFLPHIIYAVPKPEFRQLEVGRVALKRPDRIVLEALMGGDGRSGTVSESSSKNRTRGNVCHCLVTSRLALSDNQAATTR
jgi:hypothetical protein